MPVILRHIVDLDPEGLWIEPFLGSATVVLNVQPRRALLADNNPHIIRFYQAIQDGEIDGATTRRFLEKHGQCLEAQGKAYYYHVRDRFNAHGNPLDFLFLNRSCFNGVIRFNRRGEFNVPFGHKPKRFAPAYVTKIVNQVDRFQSAMRFCDWQFACQDYLSTLHQATARDFVYCDPPYIGRHTDYFNRWDVEAERALHRILSRCRARFMLSTWHSNQHRTNDFIQTLWNDFAIATQKHFYHVGAREKNRKPILEALVMNYTPVRATLDAWSDRGSDQTADYRRLARPDKTDQNQGTV